MNRNLVDQKRPSAARNLLSRQNDSLSPNLLLMLFVLLFMLNTCGSVPQTNLISGNALSPLSLTSTSLSSVTIQQGEALLQTYAQWIQLLKQSGDPGTASSQLYLSDKQALTLAKNLESYQITLTQLKTQIASLQIRAIKTEAHYLQKQFHQEVVKWGEKHQFHNPYDNISYPLDYEYSDNGIGTWIDDDLSMAQMLADYQQVIETIALYRTNFHAMQQNSGDKTPYNQPHKADLSLLKQHHKTGKVLVISLEEQAMRVYNNGKLLNAFFVTTGRPERPTPPGVWWIEDKLSPTTFKAGVPPGSPDWYPDTPITYAMQYHSEGYFIHDSWWRNDYGPGTNFPHADSSGNSFSSQGSHGCINVSEGNAAWLYGYVDSSTNVVVY